MSGIVTQEGVPLEGVQISLGEYKDPASCNFDDREASSAKTEISLSTGLED